MRIERCSVAIATHHALGVLVIFYATPMRVRDSGPNRTEVTIQPIVRAHRLSIN